MKIIRSSKHSTKFTTKYKMELFEELLQEYSKVVNKYIEIFWNKYFNQIEYLVPSNRREVDKQVIDLVQDTWMTYRARKVACYEALGMVNSELEKEKENYYKPHHNGKRIHAYEDIAKIEFSKNSKHFDCWIHIHSIGKKLSFDIPIKFHRHFHKLAKKGRLMTSCIISKQNIQLCFEIKTEAKREPKNVIALDTGQHNLLVSNEGKFFGEFFMKRIENIIRKQQDSKNQQSARRAIKHYIDEIVKEIMNSGCDRIILEDLKNITKGKKDSKKLTKLANSWEVGYLHNRLKQKCEENRISYRTVPAYNTSRTCPSCGNVDFQNRKGQNFKCLKCGYINHADIVGAINILSKYLYFEEQRGKFPIPNK